MPSCPGKSLLPDSAPLWLTPTNWNLLALLLVLVVGVGFLPAGAANAEPTAIAPRMMSRNFIVDGWSSPLCWSEH